jgi:hypothetical protein
LNRSIITAAAAAAAVTLAACHTGGSGAALSQPPSQPQGGLHRVHDPGEVTGTLTGPCRYRDGGQLPDPSCTPGATDPSITQASIAETICRTGYTRTIRPPAAATERFKFDEAYPAYGVPRSTRTELDHLVPLELGGSNDASNLWPETPPTPNPKDDVEGVLHDAVCSGRVTLGAAQGAIAADWTTAESRLGLGRSGSQA